MHQLQEQEEQQQGKAIQLRRRRRPPREDWTARTEVRLTDAGSNGERVWSLSWGIMGALVSNNYIMAWWTQMPSFTLQSKGCSEIELL